ELLTLVRREGVTVFLTTHNLSEAERLCARVAVIRQGKLLAEGPPSELGNTNKRRIDVRGRGIDDGMLGRLTAMPGVKSAALNDGHLALEMRDGGSVPEVVRMLVEQGAQIEEVVRDKASLEDVFLTLVEEEPNARRHPHHGTEGVQGNRSRVVEEQ